MVEKNSFEFWSETNEAVRVDCIRDTVNAEAELLHLARMRDSLERLRFLCSQYVTGKPSWSELTYSVMLAAVNTRKEVWNNAPMVDTAHELYQNILKYAGCESGILQFFEMYSGSCKIIESHISQTLTREKWLNDAVSLSLYEWYCESLVFPTMSDHMNYVLPPALLLLDSYDDSMKVKGIICIQHILSHCGKTELRWYGRAEVIYAGLEKLTYSRDALIHTHLHPALVKILAIIESIHLEGQISKADCLVKRLLQDMYLEDKILTRQVYSQSLLLYVNMLGSRVTKHLKLLMKVVLSYLECGDGEEELTRLNVLQIVETIIPLTLPRISAYFPNLITSLLRVLIDVILDGASHSAKQSVLLRLTSIFVPMYKASPELLKSALAAASKELENHTILRHHLNDIRIACECSA